MRPAPSSDGLTGDDSADGIAGPFDGGVTIWARNSGRLGRSVQVKPAFGA